LLPGDPQGLGAARYIRYGTKPLGVAGEEARRVSVALRSGDAFVVMTDGVISLNNRRGQQLGLKRVMDFFSREFSGAEDILDSLLRFADEFTEGLEKREDISIVALVVD
ncbi:MAG TPA: SpoIIE family protein phosphatase, partial [Spirochaetota bacterium]|nr:SpoIIE family protein phosphatase [Spirochaetota bacterium]